MERSKAGRSARWGAACAPCAAAKTRCIRTQASGSEQCDRCRSLGKDCVSQISGPRKKRKGNSPACFDRSTTLPEERLSNLINLSKTSGAQGSTEHANSSNGRLREREANNPWSSARIESQDQLGSSEDKGTQSSPGHDLDTRAFKSPICSCMATVDLEDLVPVESDETLLSIYTNQLSSYFPFVIISVGTTPKQLQATRPFLMKVIRMVASVRHLRLVRGQSRAAMKHISDAILMRSERSLDLLQGILVFLGFYHYHCMAHAKFNNLLRLAVSLVEDMDLGTCPGSQQRTSQLPLVRAEESMFRTNEEKRALLGVWYMSSNAGLLVKQLAFTKYTKYMDQCLKDLDDAKENETDQLAIQLIHIQQLTEKIFLFHSSDSPVDEKPGTLQLSMMASLEAFRIELDILRNALPSNLEYQHFLSCYHTSACLRIYEPLLAGSHLADADSQSFASLSRSGVSISEVFSLFTAALKVWLENWLAIPVCAYFYMPQPAYVQLVHSAMMLTRWIRVAGPRAVKISSGATAMLHKESSAPLLPTPALSGVPSCPDLSSQERPALVSGHVASAQILNALRGEIEAQPSLQIDILSILDTMAARFEAAKKEMKVAQGVNWENDTWDLAAEHLKLKRARVEKWCEIVIMAADEGNCALAGNSSGEQRHGAIYSLAGENFDHTEWQPSGNDWDDMQWESVMFDEIFQDIHNGAIIEV